MRDNALGKTNGTKGRQVTKTNPEPKRLEGSSCRDSGVIVQRISKQSSEWVRLDWKLSNITTLFRKEGR